jgi:hypothetical protein
MEEFRMLDHQKIVLEQVTDDKYLFQKELKKSVSWLTPEDAKKLYGWLRKNFWDSHKKEIQAVFKMVTVH